MSCHHCGRQEEKVHSYDLYAIEGVKQHIVFFNAQRVPCRRSPFLEANVAGHLTGTADLHLRMQGPLHPPSTAKRQAERFSETPGAGWTVHHRLPKAEGE